MSIQETNRKCRAETSGERRAGQLSFFDEAEKPAETPKLSKKEKQVIDAFKSLNILDMTPLEAMNEMYKLQKKLH